MTAQSPDLSAGKNNPRLVVKQGGESMMEVKIGN